MNSMLFAVMLPSTMNNSPASPADTGEAVITGRRKSICAGVPHKTNGRERIFRKIKLHDSHKMSLKLERKNYIESVFWMKNRRRMPI